MSNKTLTVLGIIAVCMVILAVLVSVERKPKAGPGKQAYLIQGLDLPEIGSIVIGTGEDAVTLRRRGKRFYVVNKQNYPAKTSEINELVTSCLNIRTNGVLTDNPANHKDLEVTEEDARTVIKFLKAEPNAPILAGIVIGKNREKGEGTYARLLSADEAASNEVHVATDVSWPRTGAIDYVEQELTSIKREDINSVTVSSSDGQYMLKAKKDGKDIVLENMPAGKKFKGTDYESVFTALTSLRFDDVKKKSSDLAFDRRYVCRLKDSTVYTLSIAKDDDKSYVSCEADFADKRPITKDKDVESQEELKKKEAKLLARDKAKEFTARHQGWVYEVPDWKAKNLTKKLSELIEDKKEPEKPTVVSDPNVTKTTTVSDPNAIRTEPVSEPNAVETPEVSDANTAKTQPVSEPNVAGTKEASDPNSGKADQ